MLDHYTAYEAAEVFGVNIRTIYNWTRSGKLRAVKIGKRWYISKGAVKNLLDHGDANQSR